MTAKRTGSVRITTFHLILVFNSSCRRYCHDGKFRHLRRVLHLYGSFLSRGAVFIHVTVALFQIETMRGSIAALKGAMPREVKKKKKDHEKTQHSSSSKTSNKLFKTSSKKKGKKPIADDDVLMFEQKKDLSEAIGKLDGSKLEKVINIIHEGVPEIKNVSNEIDAGVDLTYFV